MIILRKKVIVMNFLEMVFIAIGLAMDAFAVAVCKGLSFKKINIKNSVIIGFYFGFFQSLMPIIGYFLGISFEEVVTKVDHWVAFFLLAVIGYNMLKEIGEKGSDSFDDRLDFKSMFPLAVATSIDALAIGITFAFLKVNIVSSSLLIGIITFVLSVIGVFIGNKFGNKYEKKAQFVGGVILIFMGVKILFEHLGIL